MVPLHRTFRNKRMLSIVGEALLDIGTIEYQLSGGIPRLQSYFAMPEGICYKKPKIPSLGDQKASCLTLRDKVRQNVIKNADIYTELLGKIDLEDDDAISAMFEFVELADNTEIIYLELDLIVGLIDGLHETRNDLMHSTKLESPEGLIITTANQPARVVPNRSLATFLRKSRQALFVSSSLLVAGVCMATVGDKLYSSFSNGSYNSRFLKKLYRENVNNLSSRWRTHIEAPYQM